MTHTDTAELAPLTRCGYHLIKLNRWNAVRNEKPIGKAPLERAWRSSDPLAPAEAIEHMRAGMNVGVRLRAIDLVIDVDPRNFGRTNSFAKLCDVIGGEIMSFPRVLTPSGGMHIYMLRDAERSIVHQLPEFPGIEFCTIGRQVVAPGSVHPNGKMYAWDLAVSDLPAPPAPAALIDLCRAERTASIDAGGVTSWDITRVLERLDPRMFRDQDKWFGLMCAAHEASGGAGMEEFVRWSVSDELYAGSENEIRARWRSLRAGRGGNTGAGTLRKMLIEAGAHDVQPDAAADFEDINDEVIGISIDDEVTHAGSNLSARDERDRKLKWLSDNFRVVDENGQMRLYRPVRDETMKRDVWVRYKRGDFLEVCKSQIMLGEGNFPDDRGKAQKIPIGEYWIDKHPAKSTYSGIVFAPEHEGERTPEGKFNLWRGFAVKPAAGCWSRLDEMIFELIALENAEYYEYILSWLARAVQHPESPGQVALVVKGAKGIGKGTLGRAFTRLFGRHGLQITSPSLLVERFNAHLRDVCALFADEAFWAGDKRGESVLKGLVTEPMITFEGKGTNAEAGRNCLHIIMASNLDWVVPAGIDGERRFAVFETAEKPPRGSYWRALNEQLENGGYGAMLHDLLRRDITHFDVQRHVPKTLALERQKMRSLEPPEMWFFQIAEHGFWNGLLTIGDENTNFVRVRDLCDSYVSFCKNAGFRPGALAAARNMIVLVRKFMPAAELVRTGPDHAEAFVVPGAEECRAMTARFVGKSV